MNSPIKNMNLSEAISEILQKGAASTQQDICQVLEKKGFSVNQSKVSRLLHKLGAIKVKNAQGQINYRLPKDLAPPPTQTPLTQLIIRIEANENLIIVQTSPGSASLIARMLDFQNSESEILATLAGDDTIFVAPKSVRKIQQTLTEVKKLLSQIDHDET